MAETQEQKQVDSDVAPNEQVEQTFREGKRNEGFSEDNPQIIYLENEFKAMDARNQTDTDESEQNKPNEQDTQPAEGSADVDFVFQDATIYLNEGLDNDKFDNHPTRTTIKWYNRAHNTWYNILDLMASALLLSLAFTERTNLKVETVPKDGILTLPVPVHGILEISTLTILAFGVFIKIKWQGVKSFFTHKRSLFKFIVLCIVYIEAIVVLARSKNHVRITRALRPLFLIDSNYMRGTRRVLRQIVLSLPAILDMLLLLLFFIFISSILGFYLFSSNTKDEYFTTFGRSFVSLFVLLTTANYPDVMMPSYAMSRWSVIFFVTYVSIAIYFLMNLLLAVVYETFTSIEKDKFKKLFLHKRDSARHAYRLLCNKDPPHWISQPQFLKFMKFFKPKYDVLESYLVYKSLKKDIKGGLNLEEFYDVFDKKEFVWRKVSEHDDEWFHCLANKRGCCGLYYTLKGIHWLVTRTAFEYFIYFAIVANGCSFIYEIVTLSKAPVEERKFAVIHSHWYNILFITIYGTEAFLKLLGLGIRRYFHSGWNWFDFIVTVLGIVGWIGAATNSFSFAFIVCLRPLRLLLLFKLKQRYRDVLDTMWVLTPRMFRVILVVMCLYYSFGIIGMECFAGLDLKDCCGNISVGQSFEEGGYYYLNNFDDLIHAVVTLFELTVVNNWFIIMEGIVHLTSEWSRIFFMIFYIITMVVMTIIVAFILEAFLFRIRSRKEHPDEETHMSIRTEVEVTYEELKALNPKFCVGLEPEERVTYRGERHKTKMDLSMKMYYAEVEEWKKDKPVSNLSESLEQLEIRQDDSPVSPAEAQGARSMNTFPRMTDMSPKQTASLPPSLSRLARGVKGTFKKHKRANLNTMSTKLEV